MSLDEALRVVLFEHQSRAVLARLATDPGAADSYVTESAQLAEVDVRHRSDPRVAMADSTGLVRRLSVLVESVHAVVCFAPEPQSAYAELGLRGFWRGYFASRAAPLGAAGPVGHCLVRRLRSGDGDTFGARGVGSGLTAASSGRAAIRGDGCVAPAVQ